MYVGVQLSQKFLWGSKLETVRSRDKNFCFSVDFRFLGATNISIDHISSSVEVHSFGLKKYRNIVCSSKHLDLLSHLTIHERF